MDQLLAAWNALYAFVQAHGQDFVTAFKDIAGGLVVLYGLLVAAVPLIEKLGEALASFLAGLFNAHGSIKDAIKKR